MNIGILTHRLFTNYGGILQNYALQVALIRMGHNPITIDYVIGTPLKIKLLSVVKRLALIVSQRKRLPIRGWMNNKEACEVSKYTRRFVENNIITTDEVKLEKVKWMRNDFDAMIVGSDQVWRYSYMKGHIEEFFLKSFKNVPVKVAYAASFGTDYWEMPKKQTEKCKRLIEHFNSISVREASGINLCREYLGFDAEMVLDPTMLLSAEDYISLVNRTNTPQSRGNLMTYILDKSIEKKKIIEYVSETLGLTKIEVLPNKTFSEVGKKGLKQCVVPPIEQWLRGFMDAEFVVTDSFHGMVFSIIFNKPFWVIANKNRGLDRMASLLKIFNLEDRLLFSSAELEDKMSVQINWNHINDTILTWQNKSYDFLKKGLIGL